MIVGDKRECEVDPRTGVEDDPHDASLPPRTATAICTAAVARSAS